LLIIVLVLIEATGNFMISSSLPVNEEFIRSAPNFSDTTGPLGLTACLAVTEQQRRDVFALRHTSYLSGGYIDPRPRGLFSDPYDAQPNCQSIIVYRGERPVASVRVCVLDTEPARTGWQDIPATHVFPDEIGTCMNDVAAEPGRDPLAPVRAIEINRLVRHPDFATDFSLVFALFHLAGYMILHHETDIVFSCVRKNHVPFYKRLKFTQIAGPRSYPELKFSTNLLACSRENYDAVQRMMPSLDVESANSNLSNIVDGHKLHLVGR
jgi:hypothetical protein